MSDSYVAYSRICTNRCLRNSHRETQHFSQKLMPFHLDSRLTSLLTWSKVSRLSEERWEVTDSWHRVELVESTLRNYLVLLTKEITSLSFSLFTLYKYLTDKSRPQYLASSSRSSGSEITPRFHRFTQRCATLTIFRLPLDTPTLS